MKKLIPIVLLALVIACSPVVLADKCASGDCNQLPALVTPTAENSKPEASQVHLMQFQLPDLISSGIISYYAASDVQKMHDTDVYSITETAVSLLEKNGTIDATNVSDVAAQTWSLVHAWQGVPQHKMVYLGASAGDHSLVQINIPWYQLARMVYYGSGKQPFQISQDLKETVAVYNGLPHGETSFSPTNAMWAAQNDEASAL